MLRVAAAVLTFFVSVGTPAFATAQVERRVDGWLVASIDQVSRRVTAGVLEIDDETIRHRRLSGVLNWELDLRDVDAYELEQFGPADARIRVVALTTRIAGEPVTRYLTELDDDLSYRRPAILINLLNLKLQRLNTLRLSAGRTPR